MIPPGPPRGKLPIPPHPGNRAPPSSTPFVPAPRRSGHKFPLGSRRGGTLAAPTKVCLVILFNHKYDGTLPKLDRLYRDRFEHIRYLVPFYRGDRPDVYPVYYSSYQFEGFFRTAWERLREEGFTHYFFLADDMILNPRLTGENFCERLGLDDHRGFLQYVYPITQSRMTAFWLLPALVAVAGKNGVN